MKKMLHLTALALCLCLLLAGCGAQADTDGDTLPTNGLISEAKAIEAAEQHFGIEDGAIDEKTGYRMAYRIFAAATEQSPVYRVGLQWYVEDESNSTGEDENAIGGAHWSTLDTVLIDAKTGEVVTDSET